uniref:hypothetical protein n=1 Tax=Amycolatopsis sp. CA-151526 TaxID=3239921 RepID=UPI003F4926B7
MNHAAQWIIAGGAGVVFLVRLVLNTSDKPTKASADGAVEHHEAGEPTPEERS